MNKNYAIEARALKYKYKASKEYILKNINLKVESGEIIVIVGLSGCGKTSLIYALNGIIPKRYKGIFSGEVLINGKNIELLELPDIATMIGTVFQDPDSQIVFSKVEDEIAFGPENLCVDKEEILKRIDEITKLLNIKKLRDKNPKDLSGGEKQLVVLASVLSLGVNILILDECMSQVDEKGKKLIQNAILKLKKEGKTILMVEHEYKNIDMADKIYRLSDGSLTEIKGE